MEKLGAVVIPVVIGLIVTLGVIRRVPVFDCFREGVKEGFRSLMSIAPSLFGLVVAVTMLEASGFFSLLSEWLTPLCRGAGFPAQVLPLGLMRPVTGSGSYAMLQSILQTYGADSFIGKAASVMAGSTETTFYAITVYYGAAGIKQTRHTLPAALFADLTGMLLACWTARMI